MLSKFSVRFVIGVFGGAAVGLLVAWILNLLIGVPENVFWGMAWGIFAASLGLTGHTAITDAAAKASHKKPD